GLLEGRSWASFHDRFSGSLRPSLEGTLSADSRAADAELVETLFGEGGGEGGQPSELTDHLTEGFFPANLPHSYFCWELEPGVFHVIEGVKSVHEP
ncbi:MAG TPA: hypothetical protein VFQ35_16130, partial [Polyangiaceae bacterium]|nr:hypothetical protein [Polyangiaceae bacterium]